jgi:N4-(beta-N-acetylglucosaminyl)-L-asparaginase
MRKGATSQEACEEAIARLKSNNAFMVDEYQVGVLAVDKTGVTGSFGLRSGFTYALCKEGKNEMYTAGSLIL